MRNISLALLALALAGCPSANDDDVTANDDDVTANDDDATANDDDATADDDDATADDDDATEATGSVNVSIVDAASAPMDGVAVTLDGDEATTIDGAVLFEDAAAATALSLTARAPGSVLVASRVWVESGSTTEITLVVPDVDTASITPDGNAQTVVFGDVAVEVPGSVTFTDAEGNPYTGSVEFRYSDSPDSAPPAMNIDANGDPLMASAALRTFEITPVGANESFLQPSGDVTITFPAIADELEDITLEFWDAELAEWVEEGTANFANGVVSATVDHFTQWRTVQGSTFWMGGIIVDPTNWSGPAQVDYTCTHASGAQVTGTSTFCFMAPQTSVCQLSVAGQQLSDVTITNGCVCGWSNQQCTVVALDNTTVPLNVCGNGLVEPSTGEQCDDGNVLDNDGCSAACLLTECALEFNATVNGTSRSWTGSVSCEFFSSSAGGPADALVAHGPGFAIGSVTGTPLNADFWQPAAAANEVLGWLPFDPAASFTTGAKPFANPAMLAMPGVGIVRFGGTNSGLTIDQIDTSAETFTASASLTVTDYASNPPGADSNGDISWTYSGLTGTSTLTLTGPYTATVFP